MYAYIEVHNCVLCVYVFNITARVENCENRNPVTVIQLILCLYLSIYLFLMGVCVRPLFSSLFLCTTIAIGVCKVYNKLIL